MVYPRTQSLIEFARDYIFFFLVFFIAKITTVATVAKRITAKTHHIITMGEDFSTVLIITTYIINCKWTIRAKRWAKHHESKSNGATRVAEEL